MESVEHIESLIHQGRYFEAKALAAFQLKENQTLRVQQLYALALSKCGMPEAALQFLKPVYDQHPDEPETAGILGGIYKGLFVKSKNQSYAILSRDTYRKNFTATKNYYTGINAATLSAITGQSKVAQQTALEVLASLDHPDLTFWEEATRAEAQFISKDRAKALTSYTRVRELTGNDWGKVNSIYNQLWLLNHYVPVPLQLLNLFSPPVTVAFVGHMIDHPNRKQSRFPLSIENNIKNALTTQINNLNAKVGYCSLACGGDILFAEAMVETGGEVNISLPFCEEDFIDVSVRFAGTDWEDRFLKLTKQFPATYFTRSRYQGQADLFFHHAAVIFGTALMQSREKPHLITVQSERDSKRKEGGTLDTLKLWPHPETIININPDKFYTAKPSVDDLPEPEVEKPNDTPVLFLLKVDFPNTTTAEKEALWETISNRLKGLMPAVTLMQWHDHSIQVAHAARGGIMEVYGIVREAVLKFHLPNNLRATLSVAPVSILKQSAFNDEPWSVLAEMQKNALEGQLLASAPAAAELILDIGKYTIEYAGKISVSESDKIDVYRIE